MYTDRVDTAILVVALHESMDRAFVELKKNGIAANTVSIIFKEGLEDRGAKYLAKNITINENWLNSLISGIKNLYNTDPQKAEKTLQNLRQTNPAAYNALMKTQANQKSLEAISNAVKQSFTKGIEDLAKKLYQSTSDNNDKTVIAKLYDALSKGIQTWNPRLAKTGEKNPFNIKSAQGMNIAKPTELPAPTAVQKKLPPTTGKVTPSGYRQLG